MPSRHDAARHGSRVRAPPLREMQRAVARSILLGDDRSAAALIRSDGLSPNRLLSVCRNTFEASLASALRLAFPAVHRLVGDEFFMSAARDFAHAEPPRSAWLDAYGERLPEYLARLPQAAPLVYLADVARLEWTVNRALHAPDADAFDVTRLAKLAAADHWRVCFVAHPSIGLVASDYPVDEIWRAVLAQDDAALAAIDLAAGAVSLIVQRSAAGVRVTRIEPSAWRFAASLCDGRPLGAALDAVGDIDAPALLAEHLATGRFVDFKLTDATASGVPGTGAR